MTGRGRRGGIDSWTVAKSAAGFLLAGAVLYAFGRFVGWERILGTLSRTEPRWIALACGSTAICLVVWARAWDVILAALEIDIPFLDVVYTYVAATFADYVTPLGKAGGSPFVAYVLSTDERATFEDALASIVSADALNLVPFFTFAGAGFLAFALEGDLPPSIDELAYGMAVLLLAFPGIAYVLWYERDVVEAIVVRVLGPFAGHTDRFDVATVRAGLERFYDQLETIANTGHALGATLAYAYVGWAFFALPLYLAGLSLGFTLDPLVVAFVVPASTLASFVPTPGGLGGVEAAVAALLVALAGLTPAAAAAVALLYRVASYWFVVLAGGLLAAHLVYGS